MRTNILAAAVVTIVAALAVPTSAVAAPQGAEPTTWHVRAGASGGGDGSERSPFASLAAVQKASGPDDTIVVDPARSPLDGGILLKQGQRLIGGGAPVVGADPNSPRPRLTNTALLGSTGDAVTLAPGTEVRNLVIEGTNRSAIYGNDATGVTIAGNDISGSNRLCHDGFIIGPFQIPASIALREAIPKLPNFVVLNNGWAAVMLDYHRAAGAVTVEDNSVHDTACGDGIDVRTFGTATVTADLTGNDLSNINVGLAKLSVLAMGLQSNDTSSLTATLRGNTQRDIADPARSPLNKLADSEGVFINPLGDSHISVDVHDNTFARGDGNFSANGLEYVTTTGSPTSDVTVTNSTFTDVTGDVIESYNLSPDAARHSLTLDHVTGAHSEFPGAVLNPVVPANLGTCLVATGFGRGATTDLIVRNTTLRGCSADGLGVISYVPEGPEPSTARMSFDVRNSVIDGTAAHGINIINVGALTALQGRLENTTVINTTQAPIATANHGTIGEATLDFGGGPLGSAGGNCFTPGLRGPADLSPIPVTARHNWWGTAALPPAVTVPNAAPALPTSPRPDC
ncbi:hypothetical protein DFR67_12310 [Williamsia limnetica]|uniref:Parallel beta helix pectate lyase-like protein n=1 Tax=Williamsia limnetica TaxID=882452 RepID=A0A318RB64_WILLI|nr:hypothetical protein [Williamsia limnetica]PYE12287.1 hypothetical protein DFR67_12310 [Williamsia limnetica]